MASPLKPMKAVPAKAKKLLDVEAAKDEILPVPTVCAQLCNGPLCLFCCAQMSPLLSAMYFNMFRSACSLMKILSGKELEWVSAALLVMCACTTTALSLELVGWVFAQAHFRCGFMALIVCMSLQMMDMLVTDFFQAGSYWPTTIHLMVYCSNLMVGMGMSLNLAWKGIASSKEKFLLYTNFSLNMTWGITGLAMLCGVGENFYTSSTILQFAGASCAIASMMFYHVV